MGPVHNVEDVHHVLTVVGDQDKRGCCGAKGHATIRFCKVELHGL